MKTISFLILVTLVTTSCIGNRQKQLPTTIEYPPRDISEIGIQYIQGDILTLISVLCGELEGFSDVRYQKVIDTATIAKIMYLIDEAPAETRVDGVDTRRQLKIHWGNGVIEIICISRFSFERNGKLYVYTDDLVNTIEGLLPESYRFNSAFGL